MGLGLADGGSLEADTVVWAAPVQSLPDALPDDALRPEGAYGLLTVDIPPGEHHVLLRWGDTPVRLTGKILSLVCLGLALVLLVSPWRRSKD